MNPQETAEFTSFVGRLRDEEKLSVLLIEHDMRVVMGVSDRVTVLDYGEKIAEGTPQEIQKNERVIEAYLGVPKTEGGAVEAEASRQVSCNGGGARRSSSSTDIHTYYGAIHALKGVSLRCTRARS